jgi:hypothetical protein
MFFDMVPGVFEQVAVLYAAWANRFAGTAAKAEINVSHRRASQRQPAILHSAHQINSAARRIVFVARLEVGWT